MFEVSKIFCAKTSKKYQDFLEENNVLSEIFGIPE